MFEQRCEEVENNTSLFQRYYRFLEKKVKTNGELYIV
jgi:hypothetical protein